jgi:uncharacterized repeat protein (TIGR02543 family)
VKIKEERNMGENRVTMSLIKRYISVMLVAALVLTGIQLPTVATAAEKDKTDITLKVGETVQLTADVPTTKVVSNEVPTPEVPTADVPVTKEVPTEIAWTSNAKDVATVTTTGLVKAVKVGTADVTLNVDGEVYKVWKIEVVENSVSGGTPVPTGTVSDDTPSGTPAPTATGAPTGTPAPTATAVPTVIVSDDTPSGTPAPTVTETPIITGGPVVTVTVAPTDGAKATSTPAPADYVKVKSVKLNAKKITVGTKATFTLTATVAPANAKYKNITWSSSNTKVATVKNGKVTAKKAGTATITALTKDGKKATCKVTVKAGVKVTYNLAKGKNNGLNPTYVAKNVKTKLYAPTKKGSTFKGWYVNGKKVSSIKTKKAIKVTAKWEKVKVNAATIKSAKASGKKITVKYAKVKGAKGYEVSYSTSKKFTKKTTKTVTSKKTTATIKNLKKGTYYVKVAAYKTDSTGANVKGKASKVLTVKIK